MALSDYLNRINNAIAALSADPSKDIPEDLLRIKFWLTGGTVGGGSGITQAEVTTAVNNATLNTTLTKILGEVTSVTTATITPATLAASSTLVTANTNRKLVTIYNTTGAILYLRLSANPVTAAIGGWDERVAPGDRAVITDSLATLEMRVIAPGATADLNYSVGV